MRDALSRCVEGLSSYMTQRNAFYAQSGGVTAVINVSAAA